MNKDFGVALVLTPEEYFRALHGLGLPTERECSLEIVQHLLLSSSVVGLRATEASRGQTLLTGIILENGLTLHLWSGVRGPIVYKITQKGSGDVGKVALRDPTSGATTGRGANPDRA